MGAWTDHVARWKDCTACPLCRQRDRICLARGTVPCDVLFVGEAPGASEDATGRVFDGPAGRLLDQIVERAVPTTVVCAMTNLVCCFPREAKDRGENEPEYGEIIACRPRLVEFVNIAQPRLIVCVGALAAEYVDHRDAIPCVDIVHPAAILRMKAPKAQKDNVVRKAIVVLHDAVETAMAAPRQLTKWGWNYADVKSRKRGRVRDEYDDWSRYDHNNKDIPF